MMVWWWRAGCTLTFREPFAARWITGFGRMPNPAGRMPELPAVDMKAAVSPRVCEKFFDNFAKKRIIHACSKLLRHPG